MLNRPVLAHWGAWVRPRSFPLPSLTHAMWSWSRLHSRTSKSKTHTFKSKITNAIPNFMNAIPRIATASGADEPNPRSKIECQIWFQNCMFFLSKWFHFRNEIPKNLKLDPKPYVFLFQMTSFSLQNAKTSKTDPKTWCFSFPNDFIFATKCKKI